MEMNKFLKTSFAFLTSLVVFGCTTTKPDREPASRSGKNNFHISQQHVPGLAGQFLRIREEALKSQRPPKLTRPAERGEVLEKNRKLFESLKQIYHADKGFGMFSEFLTVCELALSNGLQSGEIKKADLTPENFFPVYEVKTDLLAYVLNAKNERRAMVKVYPHEPHTTTYREEIPVFKEEDSWTEWDERGDTFRLLDGSEFWMETKDAHR